MGELREQRERGGIRGIRLPEGGEAQVIATLVFGTALGARAACGVSPPALEGSTHPIDTALATGRVAS